MITLSDFNKAAGDSGRYEPIWLAVVEFDGLTVRLCDRVFGAAGSECTFDGNVYEPAIVEWGEIDLGSLAVSDFKYNPSAAQFSVRNNIPIAGFSRFTEIFNTYIPTYATVTLSEIHEGASVTADKIDFFVGQIEDIPGMSEIKVEIRCVGKELSLLNKFLGTVVSRTNYPGADPDEFGKILPIAYGEIKRVRFIATNAGTIDNLAATIDASVDFLTVTDASGFPTGGGVIQIEAEKISYTGTSGNSIVGCTRGYNSTTAASHSAGQDVAEIQSGYEYKVGNELFSIENVYVINRDNNDNVLQSGNFTKGPSSGEIVFNTRPELVAQVNLGIDDTIDVDDTIAVPDPTHDHPGEPSYTTWNFDYGYLLSPYYHIYQDELDPNGLEGSNAANLADGSLGSYTGMQYQGNRVGVQKVALENMDGIPSQIRVCIMVGFVDGGCGASFTFMGRTVSYSWAGPASEFKGIVTRSSWFALSTGEKDWDYINAQTGTVTRTGTNPSGYTFVGEVWAEFIVDTVGGTITSDSTGITKTGTAAKTGTVVLTGNSAADTVIGGDVSADIHGKPSPSSNYGTVGSVIERTDYVLKHLLVTYCGMSLSDFGDSYTTAGANFASEGYRTSLLIEESPQDVNDLVHEIARQSRAIAFWYAGKHQLKWIPYTETVEKTIDGNRIDSATIQVGYTQRVDVKNSLNAIFHKYHSGPFNKDTEAYREITKVTSTTSIAKYGTIEPPEPIELDYILNQSQAERVLSWYLDSQAFPLLVVNLTGNLYLSDVQLGDAVAFDFSIGDFLDKAFLGLVIPNVTLFRISRVTRNRLGKIGIECVEIPSTTTASGSFNASDDGYTQGANFYDTTIAIPIGDYDGSPVY